VSKKEKRKTFNYARGGGSWKRGGSFCESVREKNRLERRGSGKKKNYARNQRSGPEECFLRIEREERVGGKGDGLKGESKRGGQGRKGGPKLTLSRSRV